jgi:phosphatidylserine/phosphatidylglycerophosphate/cardiolipin synthase-like enzyme
MPLAGVTVATMLTRRLLIAALAAGPAGTARATEDEQVCFVPAERCDLRIVTAIDAAQPEIRVQAYGFSARPIIDALVRARRRGVDVQRERACRAAAGGRMVTRGRPQPMRGISRRSERRPGIKSVIVRSRSHAAFLVVILVNRPTARPEIV